MRDIREACSQMLTKRQKLQKCFQAVENVFLKRPLSLVENQKGFYCVFATVLTVAR